MSDNVKVLYAKPIVEINAIATTKGVGLGLRAEEGAVDFFKLDKEKLAELGKPLMDYIEDCVKALYENKNQNAEESVDTERKESIDEIEKLLVELKKISEAINNHKKKENIEKLSKILDIKL